ncbi:SsgA family sporulation/cell division regulator [Streptomyces endophyticus]|uniref:SsgA family sporulation/cell division regulator n=1 Tax=Streptomyces endophyticus TaxID=714166 RepID=A0ABU6F0C3_9ACTN|nr:SsgA family sporulation/cell division regulator [Streptomyces endophyticus]MEB8337082.1 SsgA family sporulation/cell division regulator [Streptomyces endophyticus]
MDADDITPGSGDAPDTRDAPDELVGVIAAMARWGDDLFHPVEVELRFRLTDPLAVTVTAWGGAEAGVPGSVLWPLSRDLLLDGLERAAGDGDVRVAPYRVPGRDQLVIVDLRSAPGEPQLVLTHDALAQFLVRTERMLPEREGRLEGLIDRALRDLAPGDDT